MGKRLHADRQGLIMPRKPGKTRKRYNVGGYAGCVSMHKSRATGTIVLVLHAEQADLDPGDDENPMPWYTVCDKHSTCIGHRTLALAQSHAPFPNEWCEDCQDEKR